MVLRKSEDRGQFKNEWLFARHSFSFSSYQDPKWVRFGQMRVLNHDIVQPGTGFGSHPHDNMEIVTYILRGRVEHEDSMGNKKQIHAGEVQRMSAGTGVVHSEVNPSETEELELFQIWIFPEEKGLEPSYEQKHFSQTDKLNRLALLVSPEGKNGSLRIHQKAHIYGSHLQEGQSVEHSPVYDKLWLQVASGTLDVNGQVVAEGDGLGIKDSDAKSLKIKAHKDSEFILLDLIR